MSRVEEKSLHQVYKIYEGIYSCDESYTGKTVGMLIVVRMSTIIQQKSLNHRNILKILLIWFSIGHC